jgi:hypothetical protein
MNVKQWALFLIVGAWLLTTVIGCSRGYKTGSAITAADLTKALPEFPITLPPGGTNLYLERDSHPLLVNSWLKVAVPCSSLTNFLHSFGFSDEFMVVTSQTIRLQNALPLATDTRSAASWLASLPNKAHHATEWDLGNGKASLRMYLVARPGMSSTNDKVILFGYVDVTATNNAIVYLEYHCLHNSVQR